MPEPRPDRDPIPELTPEQLREKYPATKLGRLWQGLQKELTNVGVVDTSELIEKMRKGNIERQQALNILEKLKACRIEKEKRIDRLNFWMEPVEVWEEVLLLCARIRRIEDWEQVQQTFVSQEKHAEEQLAEVSTWEYNIEQDWDEFQEAVMGATAHRRRDLDRIRSKRAMFELLKSGDAATMRSLFQNAIKRGGFEGGAEAMAIYNLLKGCPGLSKTDVIRAFRFVLKEKQTQINQQENGPRGLHILYGLLFQSINEQTGEYQLKFNRQAIPNQFYQYRSEREYALHHGPAVAIMWHLDPTFAESSVIDFNDQSFLPIHEHLGTLRVQVGMAEALEQRVASHPSESAWIAPALLSMGEVGRADAVMSRQGTSTNDPTYRDQRKKILKDFAFRELVSIALLEREEALTKKV